MVTGRLIKYMDHWWNENERRTPNILRETCS